MSDIVVTEEIAMPWVQLEEEPTKWYQRFLAYYLPLGVGRTLTQAFIKYLENENPEKAEEKKASGRYINAQRCWSEAARKYNWRDRADAFDRHHALELRMYIQDARQHLVEHAKDAAEALVKNLTSSKQGVAAAKEILNRVGLPSATVVGHGNITPYSTDDFNKAQAEVQDWENKIRGEVVDGDVRDADSDGESERDSDA